MTDDNPTDLDQLYAAGMTDPDKRDDFFVLTAQYLFCVPLFEEGSAECLALPRPEDKSRLFFPFFDTPERLKTLLGNEAPFRQLSGADFFALMKSGAVAVLNPHLDHHIVFSKSDMESVTQIARTMRFAIEQGVENLIEFKTGKPPDSAFAAPLAQLTDRHGADIQGIWLKEICTRNATSGYIERRCAALIITVKNDSMKDTIETAAHSFFSVLDEMSLPMIFMASPGDNFSSITEQSAPYWPPRQ